jgi:hypothetical protein
MLALYVLTASDPEAAGRERSRQGQPIGLVNADRVRLGFGEIIPA